MIHSMYLDRLNDEIILGNKFIHYRNRSIPFSEIKEMRVKNNRFLINSFKNNVSHPTMCIFFIDKFKALYFHDEILKVIYHSEEEN